MNEEYPDQGIEGQSQDLDAERVRETATPPGAELRPAAEPALGPPATGDDRVDAAVAGLSRLAGAREQAGELVAAGRVTVAGQPAAKAATQVSRDAPISIADTGEPGYVSRGGHKLAGALAVFGPAGLTVAGRACLDAGASTGGFTDVLLRAGAAHVVAADVGYGQL